MVTPKTLTDEMIWQCVKAAADARNRALLGYCVVALKATAGGGLPRAQQVLCDAINAATEAIDGVPDAH